MVPQPVTGVLLLFPIKAESEAYRNQERTRIETEGQVQSENVFYLKQTIGNACGTIGILHCLANARSEFASSGLEDIIEANSYLSKLLAATVDMNPDERG